MSLYSILESPIAYRISQLVFAPAAGFLMGRHLERLLAGLPKDARILDVGCGPRSWVSEFGFRPVGLDYQPEYIQRYCADGSIESSLLPIHFPSPPSPLTPFVLWDCFIT